MLQAKTTAHSRKRYVFVTPDMFLRCGNPPELLRISWAIVMPPCDCVVLCPLDSHRWYPLSPLTLHVLPVSTRAINYLASRQACKFFSLQLHLRANELSVFTVPHLTRSSLLAIAPRSICIGHDTLRLQNNPAYFWYCFCRQLSPSFVFKYQRFATFDPYSVDQLLCT